MRPREHLLNTIRVQGDFSNWDGYYPTTVHAGTKLVMISDANASLKRGSIVILEDPVFDTKDRTTIRVKYGERRSSLTCLTRTIPIDHPLACDYINDSGSPKIPVVDKMADWKNFTHLLDAGPIKVVCINNEYLTLGDKLKEGEIVKIGWCSRNALTVTAFGEDWKDSPYRLDRFIPFEQHAGSDKLKDSPEDSKTKNIKSTKTNSYDDTIQRNSFKLPTKKATIPGTERLTGGAVRSTRDKFRIAKSNP